MKTATTLQLLDANNNNISPAVCVDSLYFEKTINGTFGELWIDDYYLAEVTGLEAKVSLEKTEVNQTGSLAKGYKITGIDCKGTIKLNKVTSYFINLLRFFK